MLLAKGYPDIGWNPIEGERYLSFLRFAVFVNGASSLFFFLVFHFCSLCLRFKKAGIDHSVHKAVASPSMLDFPGESVEENSSVVVKLLIRRPECFGPALRGEGGNGLLAAMKEAIKISETPALDLPGSVHGVCSDVYA